MLPYVVQLRRQNDILNGEVALSRSKGLGEDLSARSGRCGTFQNEISLSAVAVAQASLSEIPAKFTKNCQMFAQIVGVIHKIDFRAQRLARRQINDNALADFVASGIIGDDHISCQVERSAPVNIGIAGD